MLGRLIPIAAVKSDNAVPSYPFFQNTRSAASSAVSGSKDRGRPRRAPLRFAANRRQTRELRRFFFFVSFLIYPHLITCFVSSGKKIVDTAIETRYLRTQRYINRKNRRSSKWANLQVRSQS